MNAEIPPAITHIHHITIPSVYKPNLVSPPAVKIPFSMVLVMEANTVFTDRILYIMWKYAMASSLRLRRDATFPSAASISMQQSIPEETVSFISVREFRFASSSSPLPSKFPSRIAPASAAPKLNTVARFWTDYTAELAATAAGLSRPIIPDMAAMAPPHISP